MLFVYGSLMRDGADRAVLRGFRRRRDAAFPTIEPSPGDEVRGQVVAVSNWAEKDRYEGRDPTSPADSLYWRLRMSDGTYVYVGNPEVAERHWGRSWDVEYDYESVRRALSGAEPRGEDR